MIKTEVDSFKITNRIIEILNEKKAQNIIEIKIGKVSIIADSFIICTGTSSSHVRTLANEIDKKLRHEGIRMLNMSGYNSANWILMDYGSVFVHVFEPESREFYNIERLWSNV